MKKKQITLDEMKEIELNILDKVDKICKENNLVYSLMDGSLIGAVRHNGIIPWDDDIDIMMPRPDYERLKEIMTQNPISNLLYMSSETQNDYIYPFAKVVDTRTTVKEYKTIEIENYGVYLDIFPVDAVYNNKIRRFFQMRIMKFLRKCLETSFHENAVSKNKIKRLLKRIMTFFTKLVGYKKWLKVINRNCLKRNYKENNYVTILYSTICTKANKYYTKEMFEKITDVKFENRDIKIIKDYDKYLMDLFGNYMKLPPVEEQVSNHNFDRLEWK